MKKIIRVIVLLSVMFFGISSVNAMTPTYPHQIRFSRGVTNTCYYVSSSASAYTNEINTAAYQWASMYNNINNTAVSSNWATHIDFYSATPSTDTHLDYLTLAYTTIWDDYGNQLSFGGTTNYFYTEIVINSALTINSATIAHEMGHAYGLDHYNNPYSIMYPYNNGYVSSPQSVDNDTINYLYP